MRGHYGGCWHAAARLPGTIWGLGVVLAQACTSAPVTTAAILARKARMTRRSPVTVATRELAYGLLASRWAPATTPSAARHPGKPDHHRADLGPDGLASDFALGAGSAVLARRRLTSLFSLLADPLRGAVPYLSYGTALPLALALAAAPSSSPSPSSPHTAGSHILDR